MVDEYRYSSKNNTSIKKKTYSVNRSNYLLYIQKQKQKNKNKRGDQKTTNLLNKMGDVSQTLSMVS
jgi:hypothetical protein